MLIGVTSAPALAGGPRTGQYTFLSTRVDMLNKKSATEENIVKNMFQAL